MNEYRPSPFNRSGTLAGAPGEVVRNKVLRNTYWLLALSLIPVSYTHLDVYKRQTGASATTAPAAWTTAWWPAPARPTDLPQCDAPAAMRPSSKRRDRHTQSDTDSKTPPDFPVRRRFSFLFAALGPQAVSASPVFSVGGGGVARRCQWTAAPRLHRPHCCRACCMLHTERRQATTRMPPRCAALRKVFMTLWPRKSVSKMTSWVPEGSCNVFF